MGKKKRGRQVVADHDIVKAGGWPLRNPSSVGLGRGIALIGRWPGEACRMGIWHNYGKPVAAVAAVPRRACWTRRRSRRRRGSQEGRAARHELACAFMLPGSSVFALSSGPRLQGHRTRAPSDGGGPLAPSKTNDEVVARFASPPTHIGGLPKRAVPLGWHQEDAPSSSHQYIRVQRDQAATRWKWRSGDLELGDYCIYLTCVDCGATLQ